VWWQLLKLGRRRCVLEHQHDRRIDDDGPEQLGHDDERRDHHEQHHEHLQQRHHDDLVERHLGEQHHELHQLGRQLRAHQVQPQRLRVLRHRVPQLA
jgi:hypothetical protein